jgi:GDP-L-fucose synthase
MTRKILVTGSSGLVGTALMKISSSDLVGVTSSDADLRDITQVRNIFSKLGPFHGVIHLASNVGGLFKNINKPVEMIEDNLLMNTNILKVAHENNVQNVIMCLSTCIFPDLVKEYPITSKTLHNGPPHPSNEGYAHAKRMGEVLTRAYQRQYGRRYFCVVPTNVYGPHDNFDLQDAHVIPALIRKCWFRGNEPFKVAGTGEPLRQFIYSADLARLIMDAYDNYTKLDTPLVLCPPNSEVSIRHVAELIAKEFGVDPDNIVYETDKPDGQFKKTAVSLKDDGKFTSLEDGIHDTVRWVIQYPCPRGVP